ncbi:MAG: hypothetical protein WKF97_20780 [Chitinophagaceae bacterium]
MKQLKLVLVPVIAILEGLHKVTTQIFPSSRRITKNFKLINSYIKASTELNEKDGTYLRTNCRTD